MCKAYKTSPVHSLRHNHCIHTNSHQFPFPDSRTQMPANSLYLWWSFDHLTRNRSRPFRCRIHVLTFFDWKNCCSLGMVWNCRSDIGRIWWCYFCWSLTCFRWNKWYWHRCIFACIGMSSDWISLWGIFAVLGCLWTAAWSLEGTFLGRTFSILLGPPVASAAAAVVVACLENRR